VAFGSEKCALITRERATELLGTMLGGYNIHPLVDLLDDAQVGAIAAEALKHTLLVFDAFHDVQEKAKAGNANAKAVMQSWADAEWFTSKPEVPQSLTITVFKVPGETNTDDLSPAPDATTRPDIPLHALAMLKNKRADAPFVPEEDGKRGPIQAILALKGRVIWWPTSAMWSVPARRASRPPIRCCGGPARHSLHPEQALRRRLPGQQDRADLLQHDGRRGRAADRA
jgi:aconitate hydratase 2/2-methylisocitrate dehydratase